jgi:hypothetical protein
MATYVTIGPRAASTSLAGASGPLVGPDTTGRNTGNWTVTFDPDDLNSNMPFFEVCHIVVNGAPGSGFTMWIDNYQWDSNQNGYSNSWDPAVPMPLRPGQTLYFFWSDVSTDGLPPSVTIWLRYDQDILANQQSLLGLAAQ